MISSTEVGSQHFFLVNQGDIFSVGEAHDEQEDALDSDILLDPSVPPGGELQENEDASNEQDEEMADVDLGDGDDVVSEGAGDGMDLAGQGGSLHTGHPVCTSNNRHTMTSSRGTNTYINTYRPRLFICSRISCQRPINGTLKTQY